jgi:hypothetical protein
MTRNGQTGSPFNFPKLDKVHFPVSITVLLKVSWGGGLSACPASRSGRSWLLQKRYNDFAQLHDELKQSKLHGKLGWFIMFSFFFKENCK